MRLPRPRIPLTVRIDVARRQFRKMDAHVMAQHFDFIDQNVFGAPSRRLVEWFDSFHDKRETLKLFLQGLFGRNATVHLDHDPALQNRTLNPRTGKYTPDANDPDFLVYRLRDDHRTKTYLRGDGAQRSDVAQQRYLKRVAARKKPRSKFKPRKTKHIRRSHAVQGHGDQT